MTSITITKPVGPHQNGDTINVTPGAAAFLTEAGYAEAPETESNANPKTTRQTPKRSRKSPQGGDSPAEEAQTAG